MTCIPVKSVSVGCVQPSFLIPRLSIFISWMFATVVSQKTTQAYTRLLSCLTITSGGGGGGWGGGVDGFNMYIIHVYL